MMAGGVSISDIAMADAAQAEEAHRGLRHLARQACGWMSHPDTLRYLAPGHTGLPVIPKAKAATELALLRLLWARVRPGDRGLAAVTAAVDEIWADPSMAEKVPVTSRYYRQYALIYCALAPPGAQPHLRIKRELAPRGHLPAYGKSAYLRLEARYYADLAGLDHDFESYRELYENSVLARATELITDSHEAYQVTHTMFHITDFGNRPVELTEPQRQQALILIDQMTDYFVADEYWDLIAELLLCQHLLGQDPTRTRSGAAGVRSLLAVLTPDGRIPARYAAKRPPQTEPPLRLFQFAYHTTLVTALVSLLALASDSDRPS